MNSVEIAKLAGVSRSTVSRVINNYSNVPEETRQKVLEVIRKYNYVPHASARMLAGKSNKIIGLIIIDTKEGNEEKVHASSYFSQFTSLVIDSAKRLGYNVLVSIIDKEEDFTSVKEIFYNKTISGGIFIGGRDSEPNIREIAECGQRVAIVGQGIGETGSGFSNSLIINADNYRGAYDAVSYLLSLGHRRIAHISGDMIQLSAVERAQGYRAALLEAGIVFEDMLTAKGDFTEGSGYYAAKELLCKHRPDAIFASNDHMAIGAIRAVEEEGLRVPEDISIVGFDDIEIARYIRPALTTVRIPLGQVAQIAAESLILSIEEDTHIGASYKIPVQLIERDSVRKL